MRYVKFHDNGVYLFLISNQLCIIIIYRIKMLLLIYT